MIDIEHKRDTDLPAATVWEEIRHYDRVLNWIPRGGESRIAVKGEGIGMFSYTLTAGKPIGMQDYTVVATVTPIDDEHCTIRWAGKMTADDTLNEHEIGQALEVALGNMTTGIIALLKGETPNFIDQPNEDWQLQQPADE